MAGKKPGLITGSNAKLKVGGKTLAYATDITYSVDVAVIPVEVMGKYEVITNEPIATSVSGSFTIVRYSKAGNAGLPDTTAESGGNGVGNFAAGSDTLGGQTDAFNPGRILATSTIDIEIFQKLPPTAATAVSELNTTALVKITDCRLTRLTSGLNKRGIMTENYSFVGILYDDESFDSAPSTGDKDLSV